MSRQTSHSLVKRDEGGMARLQEVPQWVASMRQAAQEAISEEDIKSIITNQVAKAKEGDQSAIKFVFDQILGGPLKGATFVQNVHYDGTPARVEPTHQRPRDPFR